VTISEFYLDYQLNVLKKNKGIISIKDLPKKRLITLIFFIIIMITIAILFVLNINILILISVSIGSILLFLLIMSKDENNMLEKFYKPYSKNRMNDFVKLLNKYKIDLYDDNKINLLIEECDRSIQRFSILDSAALYLKIVSKYFIIPILSYVAGKLSNGFQPDVLFRLSLQIVQIIVFITAMVYVIYPEIKSIVDRDAKRYEMLKFDLRQLLIFRDMTVIIK
jgi:hypothetical protein